MPNCAFFEQAYEEARPTEYSFNSCGQRSDIDCHAKRKRVWRIVLIGSSYVMGLRVPRDESFAALLPQELASRTKLTVEIYNEGLTWHTPRNIDAQFGKIIADEPDLILWPISPWDVETVSQSLPDRNQAEIRSLSPNREWDRLKADGGPLRSWQRWETDLQAISVRRSRAIFALKHLLYEDQNAYLRSFLMTGEASAFLKQGLDPFWRSQLRAFDSYFADIEKQASIAGVPVVVTLLPHRAQAAMISIGSWSPNFDPYALEGALRSAVTSHGGVYFDVLSNFRRIPNAGQYFLPIDSHPTPDGHRLMAQFIMEALCRDVLPKLHVTKLYGGTTVSLLSQLQTHEFN